jgi:hypothetical protein
MRLLLINLPRTGSTTLHTRLVKEYRALGIFNPFDGTNRTKILDRDNIVVKSGILYPEGLTYEGRVNFYIDLIDKFDKTILLSRKNSKEHLESWLHMRKYNTFKTEKFNSQSKYTFDPSNHSPEEYKLAKEELNTWNNILEHISEMVNIPISYYEDFFSRDSSERYRKANIKTLI